MAYIEISQLLTFSTLSERVQYKLNRLLENSIYILNPNVLLMNREIFLSYSYPVISFHIQYIIYIVLITFISVFYSYKESSVIPISFALKYSQSTIHLTDYLIPIYLFTSFCGSTNLKCCTSSTTIAFYLRNRIWETI